MVKRLAGWTYPHSSSRLNCQALTPRSVICFSQRVLSSGILDICGAVYANESEGKRNTKPSVTLFLEPADRASEANRVVAPQLTHADSVYTLDADPGSQIFGSAGIKTYSCCPYAPDTKPECPKLEQSNSNTGSSFSRVIFLTS